MPVRPFSPSQSDPTLEPSWQPAPATQAVLERLSLRWGGDGTEAVRRHAARAAEPERFISLFERLLPYLERSRDPNRLHSLLSVMSASSFLPRLLAQRPALLALLGHNGTLMGEKAAESFRREAQARAARVGAGSPPVFYRQLRRYKYRELLRVALRDAHLAASPEILGRETSALAEGAIRAALQYAARDLIQRYGLPAGPELPSPEAPVPGFCVLGMGKLGGGDLNFSSDIDLIYVYRNAGETTGGIRGSLNHSQYYAFLSEALTQALSTTAPEGFCYRVDLNLRPQGRSGAIALSLPQMLTYYESLGRTWERAALIKARVVAGSHALGNELLDGLAPFVWRRHLDYSAVSELKQLKAQIDLRGRSSGDDVKLGPGGIREVEFFANALQLLYGGKQPFLRERNTLRALRRLESVGLVSASDADDLEAAYLFLRRVENRLQMAEERQTHRLPPAGSELEALAATLGFGRGKELMSELNRHRTNVKTAFHILLGQVATDALPDEPLLALALDLEADAERRRQALAERGFDNPERALSLLERWATLPDAPFEKGMSWLSDIVRTADPDQALLHFTEFLTATSAPRGALTLLSRTPTASRRLLNLFGQSDFLSGYFLRHPELFDGLIQGQWDQPSKTPERIKQQLLSRAQRYRDPAECLGAMRRFKNEELLRIGLNDIAGVLDVPAVAHQLTAIAEGVLDQALFLASAELIERYGTPLDGGRPATLAMLGMGKLGGAELGYHSDLDLIFVYGGSGRLGDESTGGSRGRISAREFFGKLTQRFLSFLQLQFREGTLYRVDTRLRPSGNQGTLVVSFQAFRDHHSKRAQLWERQALIKARPVAGDPELGQRIRREIIEPLTFERPLPPNAAVEIDRLRTRMEREIAKETHEVANPKTGHGGLVDVEFSTQYLQLLHGRLDPSLRSPSTLRALDALVDRGLLPFEDGEILREGYLFHRRVESRLRLVHGQSLALLPTAGKPLAQLARRLGYWEQGGAETFLAEYREWAGRVRAVYARIFRREEGRG